MRKTPPQFHSGILLLVLLLLCVVSGGMVVMRINHPPENAYALDGEDIAAAERIQLSQAEPTPEPLPAPTPAPTPALTPVPAPTPEPVPVNVLEQGPAVTVNGRPLESGSFLSNGIEYVYLDEYTAAIDAVINAEGSDRTFAWRRSEVRIREDSAHMSYNGNDYELDAPVKDYNGKLIVPVRSFSTAAEISVFEDEEYAHVYCTPDAGDWTVPEGYEVPVLMYHNVSDNVWKEEEMFCSPEHIRDQFDYFIREGYEPIWFSDLWHIEDYEKPIILTFDDGCTDNYTELFPILKEYNFKATFFIITKYLEHGDVHYMTTEMAREIAESGLVDLQSHTYSHTELYLLNENYQRQEFEQSKLDLIRITGKEPYVLCYPRGEENIFTREIVDEYFNFGVKMRGSLYTTGDNPFFIYRYYIKRYYTGDTLDQLIGY